MSTARRLFSTAVFCCFIVHFTAAQTCTPLNQRCQGAAGFPFVPWLGCCQGTCVEDQSLGWGKFCKSSSTQIPPTTATTNTKDTQLSQQNCTPLNQRCQGAPGFPFVPWLGCCQGNCVEDMSLGWGKFCKVQSAQQSEPGLGNPSTTARQSTAPAPQTVTSSNCTPRNERCQGAPGFPFVPWRECCTGTCLEDPVRGWGKFCVTGLQNTPASSSSPPTVATTMSASTRLSSTVLSSSATTATSRSNPVVSQNFEIDPDATGDNFYGLTFSPFGLGDNRVCPPFDDTGGFCLLSDRVAQDLAIIRSMTKRIRSYSVRACYNSTIQMLQFARDNGMKVMLGVWIMNDPTADSLEIASLPQIVANYDSAISEIVVGNEAIFTEGATNAYVIQRINEVKEIVRKADKSIPVGTAEVWGVWTQEDSGKGIPTDPTPLVQACDFLGLNTHPWWTGVDPADGKAGTHVSESHAGLFSKYQKRVVVVETGYPSQGPPHNGADTGLDRLERAMYDIEMESRSKNVPVYFFEPFDSDWKRRWQQSALEIDYHFGIRKCDRTRKSLRIPPGGAL